jgi:hypothetical protein
MQRQLQEPTRPTQRGTSPLVPQEARFMHTHNAAKLTLFASTSLPNVNRMQSTYPQQNESNGAKTGQMGKNSVHWAH